MCAVNSEPSVCCCPDFAWACACAWAGPSHELTETTDAVGTEEITEPRAAAAAPVTAVVAVVVVVVVGLLMGCVDASVVVAAAVGAVVAGGVANADDGVGEVASCAALSLASFRGVSFLLSSFRGVVEVAATPEAGIVAEPAANRQITQKWPKQLRIRQCSIHESNDTSNNKKIKLWGARVLPTEVFRFRPCFGCPACASCGSPSV